MFPFSEDLKADRAVTLGKSAKFPPESAAEEATPAAATASSLTLSRRESGPTVARLGQAARAHRHRNAARPGLAAVDPNGAGHAGLGHRRLQRRRPERRHLARGGRRVGPGGEDSRLHRRPRLRPAADQRRRVRLGRAGPRVSRRPLHGDRLRSGPGHGGQGRHGAAARAAGRRRRQGRASTAPARWSRAGRSRSAATAKCCR